MLFQYVYQYIKKKEVYQVTKIELRDHLESFCINLEYEVDIQIKNLIRLMQIL